MSQLDRIELRGLRVMGNHGVSEAERSVAQPFEVDLDVVVDLEAAGRSDRVDDTIDYALLVDGAVAVVSGERHALLERIAARIADSVLEHPAAASVTVAVRKLRPPVPADLASAGVRIVRP